MFFVAALYFWDRALEPGRPSGPWLAAVVSAFLCVGLKLPYAHVLVPLAALSWRRLGRAAAVDVRTWAAGLLAMGAALGWYVYASRGVYVIPMHADEFRRILGYDRLPYFIKFLVLSRFPELIATYGGLVFFFIGTREILARREPFWLSWFLGSFVHLIVLGAYAHIHEYSCLPLAACAAGAMGLGLKRLVDRARALPPPKRAWATAGVALLVVAVPVHAALRIGHWYRQGLEYLAGAGKAANAVSGPRDLFFTNDVAPSVLLYYMDRRGWSEEFGLYSVDQDMGFVARRVGEGAKFLASPKTGMFAEPDGAMWKIFRARSAPLWDDGALVIFPLTSEPSSRIAKGSSTDHP